MVTLMAELQLDDVTVGYGQSTVVQGVNLQIPSDAIVGIVGRNGMGKTTLVHAVAGILPLHRGCVAIDGRRLTSGAPEEVCRSGVSLIPQGRRVFTTLTVLENLKLATVKAGRRGRHSRFEGIFEIFPSLADRRHIKGSSLSGGEQQMLAIARALVQEPRYILMDEPCEGLAPGIVSRLAEVLTALRSRCGILLVEQNIEFALKLAADRLYIMDGGSLLRHDGRSGSAAGLSKRLGLGS